MTKSTDIIEIGTIVTLANTDGNFVVTDYTKGWYTLESATDSESPDDEIVTKKARGNKLTVIDPEGEDGERTMSKQLNKYRETYQDSVAYSGRKSKNTGDDLANLLSGMTPVEVCTIAEQVLGLEEGELLTRYEEMNPGQIRMNAGNRIRFAIKRGDVTEDEVAKVATN